MQVRSSSASHVALLAALALALLAALAVAPRAEAFVYWTNSDSGSIGRANNDGSGANQFFITGCTHPLGMAIDGQHIYWSNEAKHAIGRANLDGTGVDQDFVTGVPDWIYGMAVTDDYIFWVTEQAIVGRANIDGSGVNSSLVTATEEFSWDIYARGSYIYWSFLDEDWRQRDPSQQPAGQVRDEDAVRQEFQLGRQGHLGRPDVHLLGERDVPQPVAATARRTR